MLTYSTIVIRGDCRFIYFHSLMKSALLPSEGLLCFFALNTRREIPYLRAPMYYALIHYFFILKSPFGTNKVCMCVLISPLQTTRKIRWCENQLDFFLSLCLIFSEPCCFICLGDKLQKLILLPMVLSFYKSSSQNFKDRPVFRFAVRTGKNPITYKEDTCYVRVQTGCLATKAQTQSIQHIKHK